MIQIKSENQVSLMFFKYKNTYIFTHSPFYILTCTGSNTPLHTHILTDTHPQSHHFHAHSYAKCTLTQS